ncbi:MAG: hypothetical protein SFV32_04050 [Opitutaceae bacterium]|nr:hypothetical protein [Opitutaceae bacterium]
MILQKKSQSHFIEISDQEILIARTSSLQAPLVIEQLQAIRVSDAEGWEAFLLATLGKKARKTGYVHAKMGTYPAHRFVRRVTIDPRRFKESGYLNEVVTQNLRIDVDSYSIAILNTTDGTLYDSNKQPAKDVLFGGAPNEEWNKLQAEVVGRSIYPHTLELATFSALGAIVDLSNFAQLLSPTLVLDIGPDSTHLFIVGLNGVESTRSIQQGLSGMVPAVMKELGLKDEESAKRLLLSNTFDFSGMGPTLVKKLITELQSSIGFYEVQTGQSIGQIACLQVPTGLSWVEGVLGSQLGLSNLQADWAAWLAQNKISLGSSVKAEELNPRWLGLLSLMISPNGVAAEKKN